jgi:hypothetical protein
VTLGFPLGLLALLAMPALVAAYFLRRKQPPRRVSALFLWRSPDQRAEAGPRFQRFSREASLAVELLAVLLAALFLADLQCGDARPRRHVVVVVDGSLSLQAKQGRGRVADVVRDEVAKLLRDEEASVVTLLESGVKPTVLAGPQADVKRAEALLEAWSPTQPAHDLSATLQLARELCTAHDQRIFFFTDGPLPEGTPLPPQVELRAVGEPLPNLGLLSAQRSDREGTGTVTVRVGNFTAQAQTVPVIFHAAEASQTEAVTLAPGASGLVRVSLVTAGDIDVSLPDDALPEDNRVTLLPAPRAEVTMSFLEGLDPSAQSALKRFIAVADDVKLATPATLTIGPPGANAWVTVGAEEPLKSFVGPFFAQKGHPVLDDVQLSGVVWTVGKNPPGQPLLSAGDAVLLSEDDAGHLHLNLDLARSNVQRTVAWPVLWGNLVQQARLRATGLPRKHLMLGDDVPVVTEAGASWKLVGPQGQERLVPALGALSLPPLPVPGRWALLRDGKPVDAVVVLALDPRESDLRTRGPAHVEAKAESGLASFATQRPRLWWLVALVLALLLVDWWLTARAPSMTKVGAR